jgi:hypothetical protein
MHISRRTWLRQDSDFAGTVEVFSIEAVRSYRLGSDKDYLEGQLRSGCACVKASALRQIG